MQFSLPTPAYPPVDASGPKDVQFAAANPFGNPAGGL